MEATFLIERYSRPQMKRVWADKNKYDKWLHVQLAVCQAWTEEGVIPKSDFDLLSSATYDPDVFENELKQTRHEMAAFLASITHNLGDEGRWLHLGLTTSDVWDTATSLQMIDAIEIIEIEIEKLIQALKEKALEYKSTLMIGRTHGVHAEPITFGLKLAIWWDEMRRNAERLSQAKKVISVGKLSGAVGTHATVPPSVEARVCTLLGLNPAPISNQVLQRDRHAQFITTLSLIAASLEKFATEIRALQRSEIREVREPFPEGQPGSSSMPHKRNPELSERVCGISRLIRGYAVTSLENVALWGERDISHSSAERVILPDSCLAIDYILDLFSGVITGLIVDQDRMLENMESSRGVLFSQRVLLKLVDTGMSRVDAYGIVHQLSMDSWNDGKNFRDLVRSNQTISERISADEFDSLFDYKYYVRYVDEMFEKVGLK